jgi:hypothetical protein
MKTVMETFMVGEKSRNLSARHTSVSELHDSGENVFGRWKGSSWTP